MRVAINALFVRVGAAGIGRYAANAVRAAVLHGDRHDYVLLVGATSPLMSDAQLSSRVEFVRDIPTSLRWQERNLPVILERMKVDVYHSPLFILPSGCACKTLMTLHDVIPERLPELTSRDFLASWHRHLRRSLDAADGILTVSGFSKRDIIETLKADERTVHVAYQAVSEHFNLENAKRTAPKVRDKYGLPGRYVIQVGTIEPRKNSVRLVEAFAEIAMESPDVGLVIAGTKLRSRYDPAEKAGECGLSDRVRFPGYVDDADLPGLYGAAELFVYPSLYEGFGLPVAEAMACGCPVIAAGNSGILEAGGDAAEFVDAASTEELATAMRNLLADPARRAEMAEKGLRHVRQFSHEAFGKRLAAVYEAV